ncbi:MAG: flavodoxin family protein [Pseudomonadota bacterium]|nr:flavodoxin family protein [Pseudomonadota bacterium]
MKKIVTLLGSPRTNGNSAAIADRFMETAKKYGGETKTYSLNKLKFRGCQACMMCKDKLDRCALKDDLEPVLDEIRDADVLVLATPVYFADITAQIKMFIDRTYSYYVPGFLNKPVPGRLHPGKQLVFIQTQAQPEENFFNDIYPKYEFFFQFLGFKDNHLIRAVGVNDEGDAEKQESIMKHAEDLAVQIMNNYMES